ncbi:hypothetical protein GYMLUDRAFT_693480 [Collybiopsis luxurians FD-317 M1]|uniref:DUF6534 domain-containing protein n=1 Tax=Collybiopsis luxurians FD-317 M1 TaxID=944289 RepID=A0A0D0B5K1_9AGAR|nr:hypothetical protein GYMLUDRAFT_693480 [Collybiopsis luxurians FD-317 M1]
MDANVTVIVGPLLIAVMFNTFLYGLCFLQFITYFRLGTRDRLAIKLMISWELLIDTLHTVLSVHILWQFTVDNFNNEAYLLANHWQINITTALTAFACPIQIFLAHRVKKLSGSESGVVYMILLILIFVEWCLSIASSAVTLQAKQFATVLHYVSLVSSCRALTVSTDIAISACLIFYLRKSRNGLSQTDYLVSRFIREAIESGSFASLFAILQIITISVRRDTIIFVVFSIPMGSFMPILVLLGPLLPRVITLSLSPKHHEISPLDRAALGQRSIILLAAASRLSEFGTQRMCEPAQPIAAHD